MSLGLLRELVELGLVDRLYGLDLARGIVTADDLLVDTSTDTHGTDGLVALRGAEVDAATEINARASHGRLDQEVVGAIAHGDGAVVDHVPFVDAVGAQAVGEREFLARLRRRAGAFGVDADGDEQRGGEQVAEVHGHTLGVGLPR